ncbi:hypothetical protein BX667DRAFT_536091 [Coemansia mojavensis]|nr:hypothetical protein BX667DRAFT_536091 [Coemansia mojavensis]
MACFTSLPDDILLLIISRLTCDFDELRVFKENLGLLAVCSRLRQLALPLVYQSAFITHSLGVDYDDDHFELVLQNNFEEPITSDVITTLDLANHTSNNWVRTIIIDVHYISSPDKGLTKVLQILEGRITKAQVLQLSLYPRLSANIFVPLFDDFKPIAKELVKLIPQINHLKFGGLEEFAYDFYGYIADSYAHQLLTLESDYSIQTTNLFTKLKFLNISLEDSDYQLPQVNTEILERLDIQSGTTDIFFPYDGEIVLPNLKEFRLQAFYNGPQNPSPLKLILPRLEKLVVECFSSSFFALERLLLPESIKVLEIEASSIVYQSLLQIKLPNVDRVCLSTSFKEENNDSVLHMNQLLKHFKKSQQVSLNIRSVTFLVDHITCTNITDLEILSPVDAETVVGLLNKLPRLASLSLLCVDLHGSAEYVTSTMANYPVVPFNNQIQRATFRFKHDEYQSLMAELVACFVLRSPLLTELYAPQVSTIDLFDQVQPFFSSCPHIKHVHYVLADGKGCHFEFN